MSRQPLGSTRANRTHEHTPASEEGTPFKIVKWGGEQEELCSSLAAHTVFPLATPPSFVQAMKSELFNLPIMAAILMLSVLKAKGGICSP